MFHLIPRNILFASSGLLFLQITASQAVFAENRVALVIGQSAYLAVPPLPNPANDARKSRSYSATQALKSRRPLIYLKLTCRRP